MKYALTIAMVLLFANVSDAWRRWQRVRSWRILRPPVVVVQRVRQVAPLRRAAKALVAPVPRVIYRQPVRRALGCGS